MSTLAQSTSRPPVTAPDNAVDTGNAMSTNSLAQVEGGRSRFMASVQSLFTGLMLTTAGVTGVKQEATAATAGAPTTNAIASSATGTGFRFFEQTPQNPADLLVSTNQAPPVVPAPTPPAPAVGPAQLASGARDITQTSVSDYLYDKNFKQLPIGIVKTTGESASTRAGLPSQACVVDLMSRALQSAVTEAEKKAGGNKVNLDNYDMVVTVKNGDREGTYTINPKNVPDSARINRDSFQKAVDADPNLKQVADDLSRGTHRVVMEIKKAEKSPDLDLRFRDARGRNYDVQLNVEFKLKATPAAPPVPAPGKAPAPAPTPVQLAAVEKPVANLEVSVLYSGTGDRREIVGPKPAYRVVPSPATVLQSASSIVEKEVAGAKAKGGQVNPSDYLLEIKVTHGGKARWFVIDASRLPKSDGISPDVYETARKDHPGLARFVDFFGRENPGIHLQAAPKGPGRCVFNYVTANHLSLEMNYRLLPKPAPSSPPPGPGATPPGGPPAPSATPSPPVPPVAQPPSTNAPAVPKML
jgi:hypothetical protein